MPKRVDPGKFHSSVIVCIARSKFLTYIHLITNMSLALIALILSLLDGQVAVINEANIDNWEKTCTDITLIVSFLAPFRFQLDNNSNDEMACPWPVTNITMRIITVSFILISNGIIFGLIWRYAEHELKWKLMRYFMFILSAMMFAVFILDCHQLRIGSEFCDNDFEVDNTSVLPGLGSGGIAIKECLFGDYYLTIFADLFLVFTNGAMCLVMNLFLRVKKPKTLKKKNSQRSSKKPDDIVGSSSGHGGVIAQPMPAPMPQPMPAPMPMQPGPVMGPPSPMGSAYGGGHNPFMGGGAGPSPGPMGGGGGYGHQPQYSSTPNYPETAPYVHEPVYAS